MFPFFWRKQEIIAFYLDLTLLYSVYGNYEKALLYYMITLCWLCILPFNPAHVVASGSFCMHIRHYTKLVKVTTNE